MTARRIHSGTPTRPPSLRAPQGKGKDILIVPLTCDPFSSPPFKDLRDLTSTSALRASYQAVFLSVDDGQESVLGGQAFNEVDPLVRPAGGADDAAPGDEHGHAEAAEGVAAPRQQHRLALPFVVALDAN